MEGPPTRDGRSLHGGFEDLLEQVEIAEHAGFDCVWFVEHQPPGRGAVASAPEIWLAAIAQHTERIRIGHGARRLPLEYTHPIRVAEMAAVLDIMSGGRLELGTGLMASAAELEGIGIDPAKTRAQWDEALRMIPKMWLEEAFAWDSEHFTMPARSVLPKPLQAPHPPLWMSGSDAEQAVFAGERGVGFMYLATSGPAALGRVVESYREAIARAEPVGASSNARFAARAGLFCGRDDVDAAARVGDPMRADADAAIIGSPERCIEKLEGYRSRGVDQVLFVVQLATLSHADVCDSLRRFGSDVIPHFER
jgi:alkanesulfonate monooxygenase SsuD/methylene tetrahydromethanopterin reductase-like flavin-dependent oxidoreductase (luciferase family)